MSTITTNYNLVKPALADSPPDITVLNQNFDVIDAEMKRLAISDYRPNLLPNGDFQLWSRGTSFSGSYVIVYTADKWYIDNATVTRISGKLNILKQSTPVAYTTLGTKLEKDYTGNELTASIKIDNEIYMVTGIGSINYVSVSLGTLGSLRFAQISTTQLSVEVIISDNINHIIDWVKLEENDHATPFISKNYLQEIKDTTDSVGYTPDILINGNFQVWQRGTSFSHLSPAYTADRWRAYNMKVDKVANGMQIQRRGTEDAYGSVAQPIEKDYTGKMVTVSIKIDGVIYSCSGAFTSAYLGKILSSVDLVIRYYVVGGINYVELLVYDFVVHTIEWIKFEENDHATPPILRGYGEELALCKRYYERSEYINSHLGAIISTAWYSSYLNGFKFDVEKRVVPLVKLYSRHGTEGKVSSPASGADIETSVSATSTSKSVVSAIMDSGSRFVVGAVYEFNYVADAEL